MPVRPGKRACGVLYRTCDTILRATRVYEGCSVGVNERNFIRTDSVTILIYGAAAQLSKMASIKEMRLHPARNHHNEHQK